MSIRAMVLGSFAAAAFATFWAVDTLNRHALFLPAEGPQPVIRICAVIAVLLASAGIVASGFYLLNDIRSDGNKKNEP
jgi:hypothetical protein